MIRTLVQFALAALMAVMLSGAVCGPSHPPPDPVPDAGHTDVGDDGNGGDAGDDGDSGDDGDAGDEDDGGNDGEPDVDPACLTGGSGGTTENLEEQSFTDDEGRTSHFHVYGGKVDTSGTVGLVLYFHGDGAWEFDNPRYRLRQMSDLAAEKNLLFVALKSPDRTRGTTWWQSGDSNARWLRDFLDEEILARYDIDRSRVLLVGYSGGAEFNTHFLVAKHSDLFCGGGALMFGGGGRPYAAKASDFDPEFVQAFRMHWYTGQEDDGDADCSSDGFNGYEAAMQGAARYRDFGFTVTEEYPPGMDHCNIPFLEVFEAQLDAGLVSAP